MSDHLPEICPSASYETCHLRLDRTEELSAAGGYRCDAELDMEEGLNDLLRLICRAWKG